MSSTGLLVASRVIKYSQSLSKINKYVKTLYVHLNIPMAKAQPLPSLSQLISKLYMESQCFSSGLDLRILIGPLKGVEISDMQLNPVQLIFSDGKTDPSATQAWHNILKVSSNTICLNAEDEKDTSSNTNDICDYMDCSKSVKVYDTVVLGGTFDRLHLGHKIFLSEAILRARRKLVIGVTVENMHKSKTLSELILPIEERINNLRNLLMQIDPSLEYEIVPISDPFGPAATDPEMELIIVSAETLRGGKKVNEVRANNSIGQLEIFCLEMVKSSLNGGPMETKESSSNMRINLLGTRLRKPNLPSDITERPYVIGLTGGIASGKSKMSQRFEKKGAVIINCDLIAHEVYEPGKPCFHKIVQLFGKDIVDENGYINRRKLGPLVFRDPAKLEQLNHIVWPEIILEVKRKIEALRQQKPMPDVVIVEAAVLLKAGWEKECHEVWSMIVPPEIAVNRIIDRNNLSEEEANRRINSQMSNKEVVEQSHVVFSSQWDESFTEKQADNAWNMLMQEIKSRRETKTSD